ncbi:MAG TPA: PQQ-binding-like beta-propeller repeat protein [Acidimicrobiia bacterium]|jgi:glucose dehydrogenase
MSRRRAEHTGTPRPIVAFAVVLVTAVAGCSGGSSTTHAKPSRERASAASTAIPPEVRDHAGDWPLPGFDYANSRRAATSPINASNVSRLTPVWSVPLVAGASTVPLVVGDTVYVEDATGTVRAIDRATGQVRWEAGGGEFGIGPYGVAIGWGSVFATTSKGVAAYEAGTGRKLWARSLNRTPTEGVDIQPTVFGHEVLVSTVPVSLNGQFKGGDRGTVFALDAGTGATVWSFDTVQGNDLWGNPTINSGGGAWYPPSIDVARGVAYFGTANPAPFAGTERFPNGSSRPGPNLYSESTIALTTGHGALQWYYQAHPHDLFDRDFIHTMLVDVREKAGTRRIVVGTGKGGVVVGLDQTTGALLWRTPVGVHRNDDLDALTGPTDVLPGTFGGVITPPASADGTVYVATLDEPTTLVPDAPRYIGSQLGHGDGQLVAIDAATGKVRWDVKVPGDPFGAATVVNDLVLTSNYTGTLFAYDRATGALVWQRDMGGGINGWPAVAGDLVLVPVGAGSNPRLAALRLNP